MKNIIKKQGILRVVGFGIGILGIISTIVGIILGNLQNVPEIFTTVKMWFLVIGFVTLLIGGLIFTFESKEHRLVKMLLFLIGLVVVYTWILPYGYFQGLDFYDYGMKKTGLMDLGYMFYNTIAFTVDKIIFLFVVAGFYGVISKTKGYKKLMASIGTCGKNKPAVVIIALSTSLLIAGLTSMLTQTLAVLIIIPFFVTMLLSMKVDKLTTFAITFGSMLIGILGAIYGTDSLYSFNYYINAGYDIGLLYRALIFVIGFILYNFFIVMRINKNFNKNIEEDVSDVAYMVEEPDKKARFSQSIPAIIVFVILIAIVILGFIDWKGYFNIEFFDVINDNVVKYTMGKNDDLFIFKDILGLQNASFGNFSLRTIVSVLVLSSAVMALIYRMKVSEYIENFYDGMKKMFKPALVFFLVYTLFVACYLSPFMPTITNFILNLTDGLNPFLSTIMAFLTSLFHVDLGYTSYSVGSFLTTAYASNIGVIHTIYVSMYGLVQLIAPSSFGLAIGLGLMKVDYKDWLKYIWMFAVSMLVILLVFFTVLTYINFA